MEQATELFEPKIVRWESPPPRARARGRVDWKPVAAELRKNPGTWALLVVSKGKVDAEQRRVRGLAAAIRSGQIRAFAPRGTFEAETRMIGEDEVRLYARFVGATR